MLRPAGGLRLLFYAQYQYLLLRARSSPQSSNTVHCIIFLLLKLLNLEVVSTLHSIIRLATIHYLVHSLIFSFHLVLLLAITFVPQEM